VCWQLDISQNGLTSESQAIDFLANATPTADLTIGLRTFLETGEWGHSDRNRRTETPSRDHARMCEWVGIDPNEFQTRCYEQRLKAVNIAAVQTLCMKLDAAEVTQPASVRFDADDCAAGRNRASFQRIQSNGRKCGSVVQAGE